ncbi:HAMP domain-containing histidine kinase [Methylocystis sp. WRRC1]|uniref:sensor histidine kinase n=1 Tax=Methylocystis sp. WRRC1 TaxID=1732014 RepID=UPI001D143A13|nr:HAMP domain-containing histidine kinase [Methylocystis sp. WRRC1]
MKARSSLALRTVVFLTIAQVFAFCIAWLVTVFLGFAGVEMFAGSWDELAVPRTEALIIDSLKLDKGTGFRIEPTEALQTEMARAPLLKFAAFDFHTRAPVEGSYPELVSALKEMVLVSSSHSHFVLPGDPGLPPLGFMRPRPTPHGRFYIAMYRQRFRWDDIFYAMRHDFYDVAAYLLIAGFISAGVAWFAVRQGLTPLRDATREAALIDMDSLNQRLPADVAPAEIAPLVDAVNEALHRVSAGVARQRRFLANAAHELRTPLAIMRAQLDNAEESPLRSNLLSEASQLRATVEQMLIAMRLTERQAPLDQVVDLVGVAKQVIAGYFRLAVDLDRRIDFEPAVTEARVKGNQRAIECILSNLIDNALRAEPHGGAVVVRIYAEGVVEVADHGQGIPPNTRDKIFEPFWRGSEETPGSGLGLAIAKELMDKHHGAIEAIGTPGGGATFRLSFAAAGARCPELLSP